MNFLEKQNIKPILDNQVYFLFRRGKKEHIEALFEKGEIYINSIDFIRDCDDNEERSDEDEGINYRQYLGKAKIKICEFGQNIETNGYEFSAIDVTIKQDNSIKGNIYCLTGIYSHDLLGERNEIRYKTEAFGDSIILIHKPKVFLNRIFAELERLGYKGYKANKVTYYNNDYSGEINFFKKHKKFKHQNEFRIFVPNEKNQPIKICIGSLKDIASLNKGVMKLTYTDKKEQLIYL
ncbi:hypothetical protein [Myroides odoratus]|uniref:Uncharacterized protein n=1 Tax=Myroides odoratus TaxID=256 RepID=A0A378RIU5_MYROD|nr:hypothetical protein [Myroides odoratus]QQU02151.1 hypothetical protein I6I89_09725 [Myroides odoratus]STZ26942.1 Uncharacterised protein [Myroides odoratus]